MYTEQQLILSEGESTRHKSILARKHREQTNFTTIFNSPKREKQKLL